MNFLLEKCKSRSDLLDYIHDELRDAVSFGQDIRDEEIESWFDRYDYIKEQECQQS